jgi:hypothetical protein
MSPVKSVSETKRLSAVYVRLLAFVTVGWVLIVFDLGSAFAGGGGADRHVFAARRRCIPVTNTSGYFRIAQ